MLNFFQCSSVFIGHRRLLTVTVTNIDIEKLSKMGISYIQILDMVDGMYFTNQNSISEKENRRRNFVQNVLIPAIVSKIK